MRILIFSTAYLPFVGGAELAIKEITDRIHDASFTLITARFKHAVSRHERIGNVEVYRVGLGMGLDKWLLPFLGSRLAKKLEKKKRFDVIWSMMASQGGVAAVWFKNCFPKKLVLTVQEGDEEVHLKRYVFGSDFLYRLLIRPYYEAVFKKADFITAISTYLGHRARKHNPEAPIYIVPNGVDVYKFKVESSKLKVEEKEEIRKKLGIGVEDKVVITTSRLVEKNGVEDLILACQYLPENIKLLILGSGVLESNLKLKTNNFKLTNRIRFVGYVPHEQLPPYLHCADVFCRPSLSEGMGSSFIEAMAAGLPVIATPVGGIPDFIRAPKLPGNIGKSFSNSQAFGENMALSNSQITGLFCEVKNPKSIAEKIMLLLSSDELRSCIVQNVLKMVEEKYNWDGIAKQMKSVLIDKQQL